MQEKHSVIVRVWPVSSLPLRLQELKSFGHVSLQTVGGENDSGQYVSFWPGPCHCMHLNTGRPCGKQEDHFHSEEEDANYCGTANIKNTVTLYGLNVHKITDKFEERKRQGLEWRLRPSIMLLGSQKRFANCTTLVNDLLEEGGLFSIIGQNDRVILGLKQFALMSAMVGSLAFIGYGLWSLSGYLQTAEIVRSALKEARQGLANKFERSAAIIKVEAMGPLHFFHLIGELICNAPLIEEDVIFRPYRRDPLTALLCLFHRNFGSARTYLFLALAGMVSIGLIGTGSKFALNYLSIKPSDILRMIKHAQEIEKNEQRAINSNSSALIPTRLSFFAPNSQVLSAQTQALNGLDELIPKESYFNTSWLTFAFGAITGTAIVGFCAFSARRHNGLSS